MGYIRISNDKQDMGKQCYPLLEHARKPQLHTVEFGVDLANVSKEVNPGLEKQILFNKSCRYFVQHDPALTTAWQLHSGLNLFEGMCKNPHIELEEVASAKGIDGHFKSGSLAGKSVNIKWYSKLEYMLDITPESLPDYYLVMTGPKELEGTSRGGIRPWLINSVFLFNAADLVIELTARGVNVGTASSVRKHEWQAAEIYPNKRSMVYRMASPFWIEPF